MIENKNSETGIIYYVTVSYPYGSGESFIGPELEEWVRRGYRVCVIPMFPKGALESKGGAEYGLIAYPVFSLSFVWSSLLYFISHPRQSLSVWCVCFFSIGKLYKNVFPALKAFHISRKVRLLRNGHIHAHWGGTSSTLGMFLAKLNTVNWSLTCHRWDIYENNLLPLKARSADFIRFISERGRRDAVALGVPYEKSILIHMGVRPSSAEARYIVDVKAVNIMCAANMIEIKGHEYLIKALRLLHDMDIPCTLCLAGDGELRDNLARLCSDMGVSNHVRFLGQLPHDELMGLYVDRQIDLFVLPSIDMGGGEHEGVPVSIMEAMSHGIPVVATDTGSINELIPADWGTMVPHKDSHALACAIQRLIADRELYFDISASGLKLINEKWSISTSMDRLEDAVNGRNHRE